MSKERRLFKKIIFDYIVGSDETPPTELFVSTAYLEKGLRAYRRNNLAALTSIMQSRFVGLERFLGSEPFLFLARDYIEKRVITDYDVDRIGIGFADYLKTKEKNLGDYSGLIIDLAKFEELKFNAVHSTGVLTPSARASEGFLPDESLTVRLNSEAAVLESSYDLLKLDDLLDSFARGDADENASIDNLNAPSLLLIGRLNVFESKVLALKPKLNPLVTSMQKGVRLKELFATAEDCSIARQLVENLIIKLAQEGWLTEVN